MQSLLEKFYYGCDYNPDQWPREVWQDDMRLMKLAGINMVTLPVFSWSNLQEDESSFTFDWLDDIIYLLERNDISINLATPTASEPAWMAKKYPEIVLTGQDGITRKHGQRNNNCPNSTVYRDFCRKIALYMAERYKKVKNLKMWHIGNEYSGYCYCEICTEQFRIWLQNRYHTLENLNEKWYTSFWGHTFQSWSQIDPPFLKGEMRMPILSIDYNRFMDESLLACFLNEANAIRKITPDIPITTNMMGPMCQNVNSRRWAKDMDILSWDSYPIPYCCQGDEIAFRHEVIRGAKNGQSFILMEQSPSNKLWTNTLSRKYPGIMRLWSYQAIAHGADAVMFFQWRRSLSGCEKLHSAIVESDKATQTRVFKEIATLGKELASIDPNILGTTTKCQVAVIYDWQNNWAIDLCIGPMQNKKYLQTVMQHFAALRKNNIDVAVAYPDSDFCGYKLIVAPMIYMVNADFALRIKDFVKNGGTFVTTTFSGIVNEYDMLFNEGFCGPLQDILGLWVEEHDALLDTQSNTIQFENCKYECFRLCDTIHITDAVSMGKFIKSMQADRPAFTMNRFGQGLAYYIGTYPEEKFLNIIYRRIIDELEIAHLPFTGGENLEVSSRFSTDTAYYFLLNHSDTDIKVKFTDTRSYAELISGNNISKEMILEPYGVAILK